MKSQFLTLSIILTSALFSCKNERINSNENKNRISQETNSKNNEGTSEIDGEVESALLDIYNNGKALNSKEVSNSNVKVNNLILNDGKNLLSREILRRVFSKDNLEFSSFSNELKSIIDNFKHNISSHDIPATLLGSEIQSFKNQLLALDNRHQKRLSDISLRVLDKSIIVKSYTSHSEVFYLNHAPDRLEETLSLLIYGEIDLFKLGKTKIKTLDSDEQKEIFIFNYDRFINKEFFEQVLEEINQVCSEKSEKFQEEYCIGYKDKKFDKKVLMATNTLSYIINSLAKSIDHNFEDISVGVKNFFGLEKNISIYLIKGNKLEKDFNKRKIKTHVFRDYLIEKIFNQSK
mgnify:CR=1 FL=1